MAESRRQADLPMIAVLTMRALRSAALGSLLAWTSCFILIWVLQPVAEARPRTMWGVYVPGAPQSAVGLSDFETQLGATPDIIHWYEPWADGDEGVPLDQNALDEVARLGAAPLITWEAWGTINGLAPAHLASIPSGVFDAYIDSWALGVKAFAHPVFLRPFHEMNNPAYPWAVGQSSNTPADFVRAWQYVHDRFARLNVDNVIWVWCPNTETDQVSFAELYPGDQYVDWVGVDGYNGGTQLNWGGWVTPVELFNRSFAALDRLSPGKPIMIAETSSVEQGGNRARWISELFHDLPTTYPGVRAIVWFEADTTNRGEADWRIQTSPASLISFRSAIGGQS